MPISLLKPDIVYIKLFENRVEVRLIGDNAKLVSVTSKQAFSTNRALIGSFSVAEELIRNAMCEVVPKRLLKKAVHGVIQGKDKCEGGYSEVEERVLRELGYGSGCSKVDVWYGKDLSDDDVCRILYSN